MGQFEAGRGSDMDKTQRWPTVCDVLGASRIACDTKLCQIPKLFSQPAWMAYEYSSQQIGRLVLILACTTVHGNSKPSGQAQSLHCLGGLLPKGWCGGFHLWGPSLWKSPYQGKSVSLLSSLTFPNLRADRACRCHRSPPWRLVTDSLSASASFPAILRRSPSVSLP